MFGNYLITLAHKRFVETFKNGQCHAMCGLQYFKLQIGDEVFLHCGKLHLGIIKNLQDIQ